MFYFLFFLLIIILVGFLFLRSAVFGKSPKPTDNHIRLSKNFQSGVFHNQSPTDVMRKEASFWKVMYQFVNKPKNTSPDKAIEVIKADLKSLNPETPTLVWFGHSTYLLLIDGKRILVDPVFNGASPVPFFGEPFKYSYHFRPEDLPEIDAVVITHDHYDHLDYRSILKLIPKTQHFIMPLGVDSHLLRWGVKREDMSVLDWGEHCSFKGLKFTATPARHFSGRGFKRGDTLWCSYVLQSDDIKIYLGGDSGWDKHFEEIGKNFGPFDLAVLECGQYNADWPNIHMFPEETLKAAEILGAKNLFPVHWGKFSLALHPWTESIERLLAASEHRETCILTPKIGAPTPFLDKNTTSAWWR